MDILEKIKKLKDKRGWSVYRLADEAGLKQSTVANMFARQTYPSITTLQQLCSAFNLTLAEFFSLDKDANKDEVELLINYRKLTEKDKKIIQSLTELMSKEK